MKFKTLIVFLLTGILLSNCGPVSDEIELKINQKVGDHINITASTVTDGGALMQLKSIMEVDFEVASVTKNIYTYQADVVSIFSETSMNGELETYNSDKKESDMKSDELAMHQEFKGALDSTFMITIDDKGDVLKNFHYKDGTLFTANLIDVTNFILPFPKERVTQGSEWQSERTNPVTKQDTKTTFKVKAITDKEIFITSEVTIAAMNGLLGENKVAGEYTLDRKTCCIKSGSLKMKLQTGGGVTYTFYTK